MMKLRGEGTWQRTRWKDTPITMSAGQQMNL
jgi:hypothetical protein